MIRWERRSVFGPIAAASVIVAACLAGCGSRGGTLAGRVTVDGGPLANGMLFLQAANGAQLSSPVIEGRYELRDVPTGPARLALRALPPPPMIGPPPTAGAGGGGSAAGESFSPLPDDYADAERSGLRVDVGGGAQRLDLELSSRGPGSP